MLNSVSEMQSPAFKGVYKVTMPNLKDIKDPNEKKAYEDVAINTVVMGFNSSVAEPRVSADKKSIYYKVDDKNDLMFEKGFQSILDDCNKKFNVDLAKKVYMEKVGEEDYNKAEPAAKK